MVQPCGPEVSREDNIRLTSQILLQVITSFSSITPTGFTRDVLFGKCNNLLPPSGTERPRAVCLSFNHLHSVFEFLFGYNLPSFIIHLKTTVFESVFVLHIGNDLPAFVIGR